MATVKTPILSQVAKSFTYLLLNDTRIVYWCTIVVARKAMYFYLKGF